MGIGPAGAHLGGDPDGFHDLFRCRTFPDRTPGVPLNAVGTLGHVGDGNRDQLFGFAGKRAISEDGFAERAKGFLHIWHKVAALIRKCLGRLGVQIFTHHAAVSWGFRKRMLLGSFRYMTSSVQDPLKIIQYFGTEHALRGVEQFVLLKPDQVCKRLRKQRKIVRAILQDQKVN